MDMDCPQLIRQDDQAKPCKTARNVHEQHDTQPSGGAGNAQTTTAPNKPKPADVGTLVSKSKKAAATLWTLLHAKVCV